MGGGIKADHGERGRGDDEAEEVGEFAVHGGGVVVGRPRVLFSDERLDLAAVIPVIASAAGLDNQQAAPELNELIEGVAGFLKGVEDVADVDQVSGVGHWLGGLPMT